MMSKSLDASTSLEAGALELGTEVSVAEDCVRATEKARRRTSKWK